MVSALCSQIHDMRKVVLSSPILPIDLNKLPLEGRNSPYFLNSFLRTQLLFGGGCSNSVSGVIPTSGLTGLFMTR